MPEIELFFSEKEKKNNFNIHLSGEKTTFADLGYYTVFKVDGEERNFSQSTVFKECKIETLIYNTQLVSKLSYVVTNLGKYTRSISIATFADIQIALNDNATITNLKDINGNDRGMKLNDENRRMFTILLKGLGGTDVDTYWFGSREIMKSNLYQNFASQKIENNDSAISFSWKNRVINPGQTIIFDAVFSTEENPPEIKIPVLSTEIIDEHVYLKPDDKIRIRGDAENLQPDSQNILFVEFANNDVQSINNLFPTNSNSMHFDDFEVAVSSGSYLFDGLNSVKFYCISEQGLISNIVKHEINIQYKDKFEFSLEIGSADIYLWDEELKISYNIKDLSGFGPISLTLKINNNAEVKRELNLFKIDIPSNETRSLKDEMNFYLPADLSYDYYDLLFIANCTSSSEGQTIKKEIRVLESPYKLSFRLAKPFKNRITTYNFILNMNILGNNDLHPEFYYYYDNNKLEIQRSIYYEEITSYYFEIPENFPSKDHNISIFCKNNNDQSIVKQYNFVFTDIHEEISTIYTNMENKVHRHNLATLNFIVSEAIDSNTYLLNGDLSFSCEVNIDGNSGVLNLQLTRMDLPTTSLYQIRFVLNNIQFCIPKNLSCGNHLLIFIFRSNDNYLAENYSFEYDYNPPKVSLDYPDHLMSTKLSNASIPINLSVKTPDETNSIHVFGILDEKKEIINFLNSQEDKFDFYNQNFNLSISRDEQNIKHYIAIYVVDSDGIMSSKSYVIPSFTNNPEKKKTYRNSYSIRNCIFAASFFIN